MLLIIALALSLLGIVLMCAAVIESPALLKFVIGALLIDASTAIAAAWASRRGPGAN